MLVIMMKKIELLDLDKTRVTSNGVLVACNGALRDTMNMNVNIRRAYNSYNLVMLKSRNGSFTLKNVQWLWKM